MRIIRVLIIGLAIISFGCTDDPVEEFDEIAQYAADLTAIDKYINENNLASDTLHHWTGIRYIIKEEGTGIRAFKGNQIEVEYEGRLLNDVVFDSGILGADYPVLLNLSSGIIYGWYYMCQEMDEGDKFTVFIPSKYAYGQRGGGDEIPPNSPLIFEMHMLKVGE